MRLITLACLSTLVFHLCACAAEPGERPIGVGADGATPAALPAVPGPGPAAMPSANDGAGSALAAHAGLQTTCSVDSDCTIKDVGNCCGHYPACVNVDSPADPEAVARECADKGLAGICGYPVIDACVCTAGHCEAAPRSPTRPDGSAHWPGARRRPLRPPLR